MPTILYIACSAYSGSTCLAFLLNTHPRVTTVGHTSGWSFGPGERFDCSCGKALENCPFYQRIGDALRAHALPFDHRNFGTRYHLSPNRRINRLLAGPLPVGGNTLERWRDGIVGAWPWNSSRLMQQDRSNRIFIHTALAYKGATVFVDNSHSPHRLRHLRRLREFELKTIHLIRDPRGVVLSAMTKKGWNAADATRLWLRQQDDIIRVSAEFGGAMRVYYEDLCAEVNRVVMSIHRSLGIVPWPFRGDFKAAEHHILGNVMRLGAGTITPDVRWRTELSEQAAIAIAQTAYAWMRRRPDHQLSEIIEHYFRPAGEPVRWLAAA